MSFDEMLWWPISERPCRGYSRSYAVSAYHVTVFSTLKLRATKGFPMNTGNDLTTGTENTKVAMFAKEFQEWGESGLPSSVIWRLIARGRQIRPLRSCQP